MTSGLRTGHHGAELPRLELSEAWQHRDLGIVLAQRRLKVRYRQKLLGIAWAVAGACSIWGRPS